MARKKKQLSIVLTDRDKENNTDLLQSEPNNVSQQEIDQVNLEYSEKTVIENNEDTEEILDNLENEQNEPTNIEPHLSTISLDTQIDIMMDTSENQLEQVHQNIEQNQLEQADTSENQLEQVHTNIEQNQLEQPVRSENELEQADINSNQNELEQPDTSENELEQADTSENELEQPDTSENELEQADINSNQNRLEQFPPKCMFPDIRIDIITELEDNTVNILENQLSNEVIEPTPNIFHNINIDNSNQNRLEQFPPKSMSPDIRIDIITELEDNTVNILENQLSNEVIEPTPNIFHNINIDNSILLNCIIKDTTLSNVCFDNVMNNIDFTNNLMNGQYYKVLALEKIKQYHTVEKLIYNGKLYVKHTDPHTTNFFLGIAQNDADPGEIVTVLISGISLITVRKNINLPILKHNINGQLSVIRDKNNKYITQSFDIPINKNDLLVLAGTSNDILVGPLTKYCHFNTANCCGLLSPYKSVIVTNNLIFNINYNDQNTILNQKNNLGNKFIQVLDINLNTGEILGYLS